jgi:hypothetical protein
MRAIKNVSEDPFKNGLVLIVSDNDITTGYLHDIYGGYGQKFSSYDAGDWCFENGDFLNEAKEYASEKLGKIDWNDYNIEVESGTEVFIEYIVENDEKNDHSKEIQKIMNDWATENYSATEATYITYWDGHNFKSIILEAENYPDWHEWELLEGEEEKKYIDLYNRANLSGEYVHGIITDTVDGYDVKRSCWEGDFEIASIKEHEKY